MDWTEDEFKRVVGHMRLEQKTVDACHDVLVGDENGRRLTGVQAATKYSVLPPHISRGIRKLGEKRDELRTVDKANAEARLVMEAGAVGVSMSGLLNAAAREAAQSIKGSEWPIRESKAGQTYEGAGVVTVGGFFVQDTGRAGVLHDVKKLNLEPVIGKRLEIAYSKDGAGTVTEIEVGQGTREKGR